MFDEILLINHYILFQWGFGKKDWNRNNLNYYFPFP